LYHKIDDARQRQSRDLPSRLRRTMDGRPATARRETGMRIGYWAALDDDAAEPSVMLGATTPEDAAAGFAQELIEKSGGEWIRGAVRVWDREKGREGGTVFDISASFTPCEGDEEGEIDCELEIVERI
jgi:hypothetical protein